MTEKNRNDGQEQVQKGYQPLNEGYQPSDRMGYSPSAQGSQTEIPPLPAGGSAQSQGGGSEGGKSNSEK